MEVFKIINWYEKMTESSFTLRYRYEIFVITQLVKNIFPTSKWYQLQNDMFFYTISMSFRSVYQATDNYFRGEYKLLFDYNNLNKISAEGKAK